MELDNILAYDATTLNMLSSKRLRFDVASFFPELTNNDMRGLGTVSSSVAGSQNISFKIPRGYISRLVSAEQTSMSYLTAYDKFQNYEGDEISMNASPGKIDRFYDYHTTYTGRNL